jgi:hypothetical protein
VAEAQAAQAIIIMASVRHKIFFIKITFFHLSSTDRHAQCRHWLIRRKIPHGSAELFTMADKKTKKDNPGSRRGDGKRGRAAAACCAI